MYFAICKRTNILHDFIGRQTKWILWICECYLLSWSMAQIKITKPLVPDLCTLEAAEDLKHTMLLKI